MPNLKQSLLALLLATTGCYASAQDTYNRISFSSEAQSQVANDEIFASLSKTIQADTTSNIAKELNTAMNSAINIAKKYPNITIKTGQQSTYPRYDNKNNRIIGFTGKASVELRSHDFEQAGQFIADLQPIMSIDQINFSVSKKTMAAEEQRLKSEAIARFRADAQDITQAFGASDYKLVSVQLGANNHHYYPRPMAMASMKVMDDGFESQNLEGGKTNLSYTANGVIELVK